MKSFFFLPVLVITGFLTCANAQTYVASTPAHALVRDFLQISPTDSVDFIRWNLEITPAAFKLQCRYGLSQPLNRLTSAVLLFLKEGPPVRNYLPFLD